MWFRTSTERSAVQDVTGGVPESVAIFTALQVGEANAVEQRVGAIGKRGIFPNGDPVEGNFRAAAQLQ